MFELPCMVLVYLHCRKRETLKVRRVKALLDVRVQCVSALERRRTG